MFQLHILYNLMLLLLMNKFQLHNQYKQKKKLNQYLDYMFQLGIDHMKLFQYLTDMYQQHKMYMMMLLLKKMFLLDNLYKKMLRMQNTFLLDNLYKKTLQQLNMFQHYISYKKKHQQLMNMFQLYIWYKKKLLH